MPLDLESTNTEQLVNSDKTVDLDSNSSDSIKNIVFKKKKSTRKSPNEKASTYKAGFKHQSSNDNNWYIVFETKNGQKRWKKCLA